MKFKNILNADKLAEENERLKKENFRLDNDLSDIKIKYRKLKSTLTPEMKEAAMLKEIVLELRAEADGLKEELSSARNELKKINKAINNKKKHPNRKNYKPNNNNPTNKS